MAITDSKLSALTELAAAPATNDEFYIRDVSECDCCESKRITWSNIFLNADLPGTLDVTGAATFDANIIASLSGTDESVVFGAAAVVDGAALGLSNTALRTIVTRVGHQLHVPAQTSLFDNPGCPTIAVGAELFIGIPTWNNTVGTLTTITDAATVYIAGDPVGTACNVTLTGTAALQIGTGHVVLPQVNEPATPTLTFGAATGFYGVTATDFRFALNGAFHWISDSSNIIGGSTGQGAITTNLGSTTAPTLLPNGGDTQTGIGQNACFGSQLSIIAGAQEGIRVTAACCAITGINFLGDLDFQQAAEILTTAGDLTLNPTTNVVIGSDVFIVHDVNTGLTASTTQTQAGGLALTAEINDVLTIANAGDTVVLPTAVAGIRCLIVNRGAGNAMSIFPASGDDLGASVDTKRLADLNPGASVTFIALTNAFWEEL